MTLPSRPWAHAVLRWFGWRVVFDGLPARQGVFVVYPHTSNWDFPYAVMAKWAIGLDLKFWAKDSLFRVPMFGTWLRWLGGVSLSRKGSQGAVSEMLGHFAQALHEDRFFWLALSPEGTRRRTEGWRSGFYQVALGAGVPLALVRLDYAQKTVDVSAFVRLSGDAQADYAHMAAVLGSSRGKHADQASPIRPIPR
ncbi:MAG: 1-acyl-sn-glycerol-3-phosphate acyltransferase [Hydrogenophaga sp.]|nr:1-acyl-sn-glycerol-3-phosphate acyltransferase [Hydrogenophaga sp.]